MNRPTVVLLFIIATFPDLKSNKTKAEHKNNSPIGHLKKIEMKELEHALRGLEKMHQAVAKVRSVF